MVRHVPTSTELPPRARRIHTRNEILLGGSGTTSACAENTKPPNATKPHTPNYLRVRGEYRRRGHQKAEEAELPPRARRIQTGRVQGFFEQGTTSACAENTQLTTGGDPRGGNYLRVRGEYIHLQQLQMQATELPPRARRIP